MKLETDQPYFGRFGPHYGRRRRQRRFRLTPRFYGVLLLAIVLYVVSAYAVGYVKIVRLRAEIDRVKRETKAMEMRNDQLTGELELLDSDAYIEQTAREELGMVLPGEKAYVVARPGRDKSKDEDSSSPRSAENSD